MFPSLARPLVLAMASRVGFFSVRQLVFSFHWMFVRLSERETEVYIAKHKQTDWIFFFPIQVSVFW